MAKSVVTHGFGQGFVSRPDTACKIRGGLPILRVMLGGVQPVYGGRASGAACLSPARRGTTSSPAAESLDDVTDERLLERYLNGELPAFQTLVERYQRELFHFLIRFLGDRAAAEDVFQEAFLQVHQSGHSFDLSRRFRPWLFTIAANKARDLMRSQARRPTNPLQADINPGNGDGGQFIDLMAADVPEPSEPLRRQELQQQVQGVVMGMPDHLREILLLSYFHQFPYKQIADILEIPLGTVKSRLHSAVANFAERWKQSQGLAADGLNREPGEAKSNSAHSNGNGADDALQTDF